MEFESCGEILVENMLKVWKQRDERQKFQGQQSSQKIIMVIKTNFTA